MGQGSAQTRCWSQLREKVVEYWWLAVAGAILAYPVLHRANMYWSDRWYHKTKQEKLTWSWLSNVFNTPCLHSVEDWYHASNWPWNQNDPHTADLIHSTTLGSMANMQTGWKQIPFNLWNDSADVQCSRMIFIVTYHLDIFEIELFHERSCLYLFWLWVSPLCSTKVQLRQRSRQFEFFFLQLIFNAPLTLTQSLRYQSLNAFSQHCG